VIVMCRRKSVRPRDADGDRVEWDIPVDVRLPSDYDAPKPAPVKTYVDARYISPKEWRD
jgi:hypothetical protein